jgi:ATP-binding cassette subfamily B protein
MRAYDIRALPYVLSCTKLFPLASAVMLVVALFTAIDSSLRPYIMKVMLNRISSYELGYTFTYLLLPAVLYISLQLTMSSLYRVYGYFVEIKMIPSLRQRIALDMFSELMSKSQDYYQNNNAGNLANQLNNLTASIPDMIQIIIDRFWCNFLSILIAGYTLTRVNLKFALLMLAWTSAVVLGSIILASRLAELTDKWSECNGKLTSYIVDVLFNILAVRIFTKWPEEQKRLDEAYNITSLAERKLQQSYFWIWFSYGYLFIAIQAINLYLLLKGRQEGWITVGDFALVLGINTAVVDLLWQMTKDFAHFSRLFGRLSHALRIISSGHNIEDEEGATELVVTKGDVAFDNVKFHYKGSKPLFDNLSVNITGGQKVGLVGYSGGGKTTFANLISRLYDITDGKILIDGQDIRQCTQKSLRSQIAMISQDSILFNRTVRENISYGNLAASEADVINAATRAHAHEFIIKLPGEYDFKVGERGVKLSGGQRQRIAIARAMLKDAPILILDEATSQLDAVTEMMIQESLWQLMQGKTAIVIAHRLSTLLHMDRILVFDHGQIVEDASHIELLAKGGIYTSLWQAQVGNAAKY